MAKHLYGYDPSSYTVGGSDTTTLYSRTADTRLRGSSLRYLNGDSLPSSSSLSSSMLYNADSYSSKLAGIYGTSSYGPPGIDAGTTVDSTSSLYAGLKRSSESLYHQTLFGAYNTIGQTEAWYSTNPLTKHPRYESTSHLPIYPQRPGEKDCAYYMKTRTCMFGEGCKFDHPIWVPEGGVPDWKEVAAVIGESLPERPGEPDCPYFLKTQNCKFGIKCKFNHPKDSIAPIAGPENGDGFVLPERPSEPPCAFYMKTGKCKFGVTCKFHHPKEVQIQSAGEENGNEGQNILLGDTKPVQPPFPPASMHNSKGLPVRPGEEDCPFYLKTGSCKYGATCRYNHPERNVINPLSAAIAPASLTSPSTHFNMGFVNPASSLLPTYNPRLTQATLGLGPTMYPQRAGQPECDYYMKTGICKFGFSCKFHHPIDRTAPAAAAESLQQNLKLTLAGLPRREGAVHCPYYMKTGTCKYGVTCRFDHPLSAEVMAMATLQGRAPSAAISEVVENI